MKNQIEIFSHPEFGKIRTMKDENGESWFVGKDVAGALGYANPSKAVIMHVEEEDIMTQMLGNPTDAQIGNLLRKSKTTFINESGLYSLILSSKLEGAKRFKHWVTSEVLPQIRKTGGYIPVHEGESAEATLARAVEIYESTIAMKNLQIESLQPKAEYCDEVLKSVSAFPVRVVAHTLGMTAQELNRFLCEHGVQYGQSGSYVPYAMYAKKGYTKSRTYLRYLADGNVATEHRTKWTESGIRFIIELVNETKNKEVVKPRFVQLEIFFA